MDRRKLMIGADITRCIIVGILAALIATDQATIWILYACSFLLGTCETLHTNCAQAIIPALVKQDQLIEANARFTSAQVTSAQFVGPSLGVVLFNAYDAVVAYDDDTALLELKAYEEVEEIE